MTYAKEHSELWDLQYNSDVIDYEVLSTVSHLKIPSTYLVTYTLRSIVGVGEDKDPVFAEEHQLELTLPTRYPLEPARIFMRTDTWHPNIQSKGRFKGKICGNVDGFGVDYTLKQLVLRVGEMLQFKNYLADFRPPYPEDPEAARWIKEYAEPQGIVHRAEGKYVDDSLLVRKERREPPQPIAPASAPPPDNTPPSPTAPPTGGNPPMIIKRRTPPPSPPRRKLKL